VRTAIALNPTTAAPALLLEAAVAAERAGFDAVYCYDHLSGKVLAGPSSQHVWTVLGAKAAVTERVRVGPLVANVTVHPAVDIALAAATLQSLSRGRFVLGLGAGASGPSVFASEMPMFGLPAEAAPRRRARVAETIELLRALWRGDTSFAGEWASFTDVEAVPHPEPACPIVVGANGPKMAAVAARHADGINVHHAEVGLAELVGAAVGAARANGNDGFFVSVEVPYDDDWLDPASERRRALASLGVAEVVLAWTARLGVERIAATRVVRAS
jgi:alkanesulfonate monooxygenase SsuD/methylene tetrahydromethanopterin reductase-like flavin-dependent oxidoreductase (luciferase family)